MSISSPQTKKTPMAAAWCCHLVIRKVNLSMLSRGLLWKLTITTLTMIPHWTQFSQLRKYNFWLCISWNTSLAERISVDMMRNTHTMMVVHVILERKAII